MNPATHHITIHQGQAFDLVATCKDADGVAVDLTDWSVFAEVRKTASDTLLADLAPTISDAEAGEVTIDIADEVTAPLAAGSYRWDLILEKPDGDRIKILAGKCNVIETMTQPE